MLARRWTLLVASITILLVGACSSPPAEDPATSTPTAAPAAATDVPPTETSPAGVADEEELTPTATPTATPVPPIGPSVCADLSGSLEAQILVGPAEVVGLEPAAVGSIPFTVTPDEGTYVVEGQNTLSYENVLEREWGTYSVSLDMAVSIEGACVEEDGSAVLDLTVVNSGEQMVEVSAGGFQQEYPWSGENTFNISLPVEEGASAGGEGWLFVLHLD